jgi:hypothetical protein
MIEFLHSIRVLFGVAGIVFAAFAVVNLVSACMFPKDMVEQAWPYAKKAYIFLGLVMLSLVLCCVLNLCV